MGKKELAICIGDEEYQNRFTNCLINHYKNQFRISMFTSIEELENTKVSSFDVILIGDYEADRAGRFGSGYCRVLFLREEEPEFVQEGQNLFLVNKYQPVHKIVDIIFQITGMEEKALSENIRKKAEKWGVYALSNSQLQIPFAMMLSAVKKEKSNVLFLDLQENSGLMSLEEDKSMLGLEELLTLAETGVYTKGRVVSAIGHLEYCDYVYPARNSQCITEADITMYEKMFRIIEEEMDYEIIVINFGSRFQGFFELMSQCENIYYLKNDSILDKAREQEFIEEMTQKGYENCMNKLIKIPLSGRGYAHLDASQLIKLWQWGELGDLLRNHVQMEPYCG
uniref:hypothetical protein n=1 Tax=Agathobacter sp. TaxID=2021311 RepID=UPI0040575DE6